ncbi:arylesterase [Roseovarius sp. C7]|uniref:arylesterase n=1 Tax=Roseovarius sp. C7 TaxID=3398643 RepID=UPI0039F662AC
MRKHLVDMPLTYGVVGWIGKAMLLVFLGVSPLREAGATETGREVGKEAGDAVVILALGDSLTQGYGLPEPDGFVPQLEAWLRADGAEVRLINGGVSGDTTAGGAGRIAWGLTDEVDAVIVALGGNDFLRGIDPAVSRENLDMILTETGRRELPVLLVGMTAPGNYGRDYKAQFDAIYPELAEAHGVLLAESFFQGLPETDPDKLREFFQEDGLHPNARGVGRIVEGLGPDVLRLVDEVVAP